MANFRITSPNFLNPFETSALYFDPYSDYLEMCL